MMKWPARGGRPAGVDPEVQVYPGASLFKANDQWNATVNGQLDITLFPLDYASGKVPVFSATLMPGLIRNQERARRVNDTQFMKDVRAEIEKHGVIVLPDAGKKAQAYYEGKADAVNKETIKAFEDHKKKVVTLSDADYNAWLDVARKSSYARFAKDVPNGQKLIDEALAVK